MNFKDALEKMTTRKRTEVSSAAEKKANSIIAKLESRLNKAAAKGRNEIELMRVRVPNGYGSSGHYKVRLEIKLLTMYFVAKHYKEFGLHIELCDPTTGTGNGSGYASLSVNWGW